MGKEDFSFYYYRVYNWKVYIDIFYFKILQARDFQMQHKKRTEQWYTKRGYIKVSSTGSRGRRGNGGYETWYAKRGHVKIGRGGML